jgi:hypothetical protein
MLRALCDEDALRVFAGVVSVTGTGLPQRSDGALSVHYVTAHGLSSQTGLPVDAVLGAAKRLTDAHLAIEADDGRGWRTDFHAIRRAGDPEADGPMLARDLRARGATQPGAHNDGLPIAAPRRDAH